MQLVKLVICLTLILILLCFIFRLYLQLGWLMFVLMALHILLFIVYVVSIVFSALRVTSSFSVYVCMFVSVKLFN